MSKRGDLTPFHRAIQWRLRPFPLKSGLHAFDKFVKIFPYVTEARCAADGSRSSESAGHYF
jgi:hypothetical protein